MRLIPFFLLLIAFTGSSFAQEVIRGIIIDSKSKEPLPYAHIYNLNSYRGAITNEDGAFRLNCSKGDSIRVSYIGYQTENVPYTYFLENTTYLLQALDNELKMVEIASNADFIIDLLMEAKNKMWKGKKVPSKTYFTLKSTDKDRPVELLECYYNSEIEPVGFGNLKLKNGRVGLAPINQNYFVSLSTTKIISNYNLLEKGKNIFPMSPLHLSKGRVKNVYDYEILELKNGIYKVEFNPKDDELQEFFKAIIYLDKSKKQLVRIELLRSALRIHPFSEINEKDKMGNLNYQVSYTYDNSTRNQLEKVEFDYEFDYNNTIKVKRIKAEGIFLFYDKDALFDIPYYSEPKSLVTDYEKIISQPYNHLFWFKNKVLLPSKRSVELKNFFNENGVLLNFNTLTNHNNLFKNKIVPWSEKRLFPYEINWRSLSNRYVESESRGIKTTSKLYDLSVQIYLDRNVFDDSIYYNAKALIDLEKSYCFMNNNNNASCLINVYFDLAEIAKEKMLSVLNQKKWTKNQVDSIFNQTHLLMEKELKGLRLLSDHGKNEEMLGRYINKIKKNLHVDNSLLLADQEFKSQLDQILEKDKNAHIELYKYADALVEVERYEEAHAIFEQILELGDNNTWVYYNMGLNYLAMNDLVSACFLFEKCASVGKTIDPEVLKNCED